MRTGILAAPVAFNEEKKIGRVLDRFRAGDVAQVILVDDGSTDGTPREAEARGVKVLRHSERRGVGAAIRTAIRYAQSQRFEILVIVAGNDKDRPEEIPRLVRPIIEDGYELVQGSRYMPGGSYGNMPLYRQVATRFVHPWLFTLSSGYRITDSTNGFRAIHLRLFDDLRIDIEQAWLDGYELEPYILYKSLTLGHRVVEVPVTKIYPDTALGYTKMQPITGWWKILRPLFLLALGLRR
ncbi:MAG: glycosyltransferase family 2 protein [Candidatus Methylomirabilales bacterium]